MPVVSVPRCKQEDELVCVVCRSAVLPNEATAGSYYADGELAFACNKHLLDRPKWIVSWAQFDAEQEHLSSSSAIILGENHAI